MDKLNLIQINEALKDVRNAYRLLSLYQKRLLDIIKYVTNGYNVTFNSGWSKFSNTAYNGSKVALDKWSWDWLSMYLYEFNLGEIAIDNVKDKYYLKIVHQGDTGFYDANEEMKISQLNADQFGDVNAAVTRLFFIISKNDNGCPEQHILNGNLTAKDNSKLVKGNWLAVPYNLQRFSNQSETDLVLKEFNTVCKDTFGVELVTV